MNTALVVPTEQENVTLRQLTLRDAEAYYEAIDANRGHLSQFGDETSTKYPDLKSVEESIAHPDDPNKLRMGIWDGEAFVGSINLTPSKDRTDAEVGYWLDERHTGNGYATLATRALARYAKVRFPKIYAEVAVGNEASAHVLKRSGFTETAKEAGRLIFEFIPQKSPEAAPAVSAREVLPGDAQALRPILETWIKDRDSGEVLTDEIVNVMAVIEDSAQGLGDRQYLVAEDSQGKVAGVMGMVAVGSDMQPYVTSAQPIELINAYIDPNQRGAGIGKLLAKALEERASRAGATEVVVNSGPRYKDTGWAFWTSLYGEPVAIQKDMYGPGGDAPVWRKSLIETA